MRDLNKFERTRVREPKDNKELFNPRTEQHVNNNDIVDVRKMIYGGGNGEFLNSPAILYLNDYMRQFEEYLHFSNTDIGKLNKDLPTASVANCANCGVWYNPENNKLEYSISPLSKAIDNMRLGATLLSNIPDSNYRYYHKSKIYESISYIYLCYISSALTSYFYSFTSPISKNNDRLQTAITNLTLFTKEFHFFLLNFMDQYKDIKQSECNEADKMDAINSIISLLISEFTSTISCRISNLITALCYKGTFVVETNEISITFEERDIRKIYDMFRLNGYDIHNTSELFQILNECVFIVPFHRCGTIIEILLWQCIQTVDYILE